MKVAIINTPAKGTEVHAHNCADVKKSESRNGDAAWIIDAESRVDVSHTYWNDQISDVVDPDSAEGWATAESWLAEFNFLPCASALPHDHRGELGVVTLDGEETTIEVEATPAVEVTTWVGKAIAARINEVYPNTHSLTTKVREAKVTKAGDRTIKFTAEEAIQLRELCTELEAKGGSLAYSARTLRSRLA